MTVQTKPDALLFDLDGTLFRTETLLLPAYHATFAQLRAEGAFEGQTPPEAVILGSLGQLLSEIWARVLPAAPTAVRERANVLLLDHQLRLLADGVGELYDGVADTLHALHERGLRLFVASNGLEGYVKGVIRAKGLGPLFDGLYSAGEYATASKVDLVRILLAHHAPACAWMVGDRSSDVEAGKASGLTVVGCNYAGFHQPQELEDADIVVDSFAQLLDFVD